MATAALPLLLLALSFFAVSVSGRPCKTLFFYSTTTSFPQNPNPTFNTFTIQRDFSYSPKFLTLFLTTVHGRDDSAENRHPNRLRFTPRRPAAEFNTFDLHRPYGFPIHATRKELFDREEGEGYGSTTTMPVGLYSTVTRSSIRDRTRDIMSVVGALLFGVGCGALTAATMYLIWNLFSPNRFDFDDSDDDEGFDNSDDDDGTSPKKIGYVTIPHEDIDAVKKAAQAEALAKGIAP